jgi:hypothetical protein
MMPRLHERRIFHAPSLFSNVNKLWLRVGYVVAVLTEEWRSVELGSVHLSCSASRQIYLTHVVMAQVKHSTGNVPSQHVPVDQTLSTGRLCWR